MKFRNNKSIKKKGGTNPLNYLFGPSKKTNKERSYSKFISYPPKKYELYNDNSSRVGTSSTDSMTAETNNDDDELAFGTQFGEELYKIRDDHKKKLIKNDYELKKEKNLDQYLKDTTPVNPTRSQRALKMIQDIVPPRISKEPFKGHVFGLNPVKEKLLEDAIVKKKAENIVSDVSNIASRKVYNKARGIQFDQEQKALKEKYNQNMSNLEEEIKLRDEKLQYEKKLRDEKLQEEMKLKNYELESNDLESNDLESNDLESNDIQDEELEKKITDIYDRENQKLRKFFYLINPNDFFKGANELRLISENGHWIIYNRKIEITEEEYSELSKDYGQLLNNKIDRIIEKKYDEIAEISSQYSNEEKKKSLCVFILVLLKIKYFRVYDMSDQLTKRGYGGKKITNCCNHTKKHKLCMRKNDKKLFKLPRRFTKKQCKNPRGFTMKASCAPYKNCGGGKKKKATCKLVNKSRKYKIDGKITIEELPKKGLKLNYNISGLTPGKHGFHIHEFGDLNNKCMNCGSHFNPFKKNHCKTLKNCHLGDLGNVVANKNGIAKGSKFTPYLCLKKNKKCNVINRSIIVHDKKDDLGKGKNEESKKTGNAGKRLACGIIKLI